MFRYYLILAAVLGTGILIGYTLLEDTAPEPERANLDHAPPPAPAAPAVLFAPGRQETLAALQQQLQQESVERKQLTVQLEELQRRIEELETGSGDVSLLQAETGNRTSAQESTPTMNTSVQSLVEAGIPPEQATWIQARLDEIDLQQLYLRDRATREGWLNKPRYHKERRKHQDAMAGMRSEIGDDAYDRMLYTLGRANRVVVRDTMLNSPAEQYGMLPGDRIIEYDGQRIFSSNELNTLATQGDAGLMTLVRVQRDGEIHDLYLPRGPLGIRMSTARDMP